LDLLEAQLQAAQQVALQAAQLEVQVVLQAAQLEELVVLQAKHRVVLLASLC
jgi:hypothetical protein